MKAIEVTNLVKKYGKFTAVDNISFSVEKGSICAILGPNGSGKTTTIKSICNLIIPDKGEIKLEGKSNKKSVDKISALFEGTRNLYWRLTPRENLRYFAGIRGLGGKNVEKTIDELLERFSLTDKRDVMVNNLSRGMQQKVAIAMTLICNTDIVLLDEPTLGLDIESFMDIKNLLRNIATDMKKTILLSTHDMNLVQDVCNDVVILNKGKIVAQDTLVNLLEMFRSMTYEFILVKAISKEDKNYLLKLGYSFYFTNDDSILEIDIVNSNKIYNIIDVLKEKQILIKEIKQKEINFERVYLNLISGGKR
ncbi:ABC transporter ATP-binding protein [Clostridium algidicarnis]|uniref:ABC transporter ATP-binding protein n=1 Tax=Clostridium algidicarnis TaxID=37659 RepID=A0ABS6C1W5_9CLOT|nr:ABC transporter ATP-binding protein [Clostridium algidicarnis]MBB6631392.1 ABC transporter ATP-binding protein [Clostridium algidicarnis]MBB6697130.1 ABC transporter ATP-binding protein [Clostridium algidicarnis]MBU3219481.1 ABC transporter ATP-binding protein [Clostridium algidicarnis]MCB2287033.1 ABC transporter ATP-binding protein [Clostridium algidicarnis]